MFDSPARNQTDFPGFFYKTRRVCDQISNGKASVSELLKCFAKGSPPGHGFFYVCVLDEVHVQVGTGQDQRPNKWKIVSIRWFLGAIFGGVKTREITSRRRVVGDVWRHDGRWRSWMARSPYVSYTFNICTLDRFIDTWAREIGKDSRAEWWWIKLSTIIFLGIGIHFLAILVWGGWGFDPQPHDHWTILSLVCCLLRNVVGGLLALCVPSQARVFDGCKRDARSVQVLFSVKKW